MLTTHRKEAGKFTVTVGMPAPRWVRIECRNNGACDVFQTLTMEDANDLIYALERAVTLAKAEDDDWRAQQRT